MNGHERMERNGWALPVFLVVMTFLLVGGLGDALAQAPDDWTEPATTILERLASGLKEIGLLAVGLGLMFLGLMAALFGQLDGRRLMFVIVGGMLILAYDVVTRFFASP